MDGSADGRREGGGVGVKVEAVDIVVDQFTAAAPGVAARCAGHFSCVAANGLRRGRFVAEDLPEAKPASDLAAAWANCQAEAGPEATLARPLLGYFKPPTGRDGRPDRSRGFEEGVFEVRLVGAGRQQSQDRRVAGAGRSCGGDERG